MTEKGTSIECFFGTIKHYYENEGDIMLIIACILALPFVILAELTRKVK